MDKHRKHFPTALAFVVLFFMALSLTAGCWLTIPLLLLFFVIAMLMFFLESFFEDK